jgi:hypothetical protein
MRAIILLALVSWQVCAIDSFSVPEGKVYFKLPKDGAEVSSPVKIVMGLDKIKLRIAGENIDDHKSGHHHIIVDGKPIAAGEVVPADPTHLHYGKAQTEAEIKLPPGPHTLTLQLADGAHRSYGPSLSQTIHINIK